MMGAMQLPEVVLAPLGPPDWHSLSTESTQGVEDQEEALMCWGVVQFYQAEGWVPRTKYTHPPTH